jgi:hypothetical protein
MVSCFCVERLFDIRKRFALSTSDNGVLEDPRVVCCVCLDEAHVMQKH